MEWIGDKFVDASGKELTRQEAIEKVYRVYVSSRERDDSRR